MCVHTLQKLKKELLGGGATTVKRYRKTNGSKQLLGTSGVSRVVATQEPIVSPEVGLMKKHIFADYERDPKLDRYPNAMPKSLKPLRLVRERAAAEQEIVEDFLRPGWIEPCPASGWASDGFIEKRFLVCSHLCLFLVCVLEKPC